MPDESIPETRTPDPRRPLPLDETRDHLPESVEATGALPVTDALLSTGALPPTAAESVSTGPASSRPTLGEYELLGELGRGGMGRVYKARHVRLGRLVALKTILTGHRADEHEIERFRREAESAARLDHPGIVPVYEFSQADGQHFFTMALIDGESLAGRLKAGPLEPRAAAYIVEQAARAVEFAHRAGIIHRDVKPGNILLQRDGAVRVTDFGLARQLGVDELAAPQPGAEAAAHDLYQTLCRLTQTGVVMGTPAYMAPEQALDAKNVGPPADVWALGAVLFASLTGRPPFVGNSAIETLALAAETRPPALRDLNPAAPPELEAICLKCLERDPHRRYASAAELAADLARWRAGRTPRAARVPWPERIRRADQAWPEIAPICAGALASRWSNVQEGLFVTGALWGLRCAPLGEAREYARWAGICGAAALACTGCLDLALGDRFVFPLVPAGGPATSAWLSGAGTLSCAIIGWFLGRTLVRGALAVSAGSPLLFGSLLALPVLGVALAVWVLRLEFALQTGGLADLKPNSPLAVVLHHGGPLAAALVVFPLALAGGVWLNALRQRVAGSVPLAADGWHDLKTTLCGGCASTALLAAFAAWLPAGPEVQLDRTGLLGPGPLLVTLERAARTWDFLPLQVVWPLIFCGKFLLIWLALAAATCGVAWTARRRNRE